MSDFSQMPGMGPMSDTLKFMRELWSGVKMPGVSLPSLSLEDIEKQIADLKAVEGWLALNMHMLKATIQTLEVQRATLSALEAMGQNVGASVGQSMEQAVDAAMHAAGAMSAGRPPMPGASAPDAAASTTPGAAPAQAGPGPSRGNGHGGAHESSAQDFSFATPQAEKPVPPVAEDEPAAEQTAAPPSPAAGLGVAAPFVDPAAWWGLLQDQFKHAMETAVTGNIEPAPGAQPAAPARSGRTAAGKAGKKTAAKPAAKKSAAKKAAAKKAPAKKATAKKAAHRSGSASKPAGKAAKRGTSAARKS